jgi:aconitate hydratase 2/2-methylisocitrate dehydratase
MAQIGIVGQKAGDIYRYMNFDQIADFREIADTVTV